MFFGDFWQMFSGWWFFATPFFPFLLLCRVGTWSPCIATLVSTWQFSS